MIELTLEVNGAKHAVEVYPGASLLEVLRDTLDLTGTKCGCGEGACGACTVLIDGKAERSCTVSAQSVAGRRIVTIEGLEKAGRLHPVQQAFLDKQAFQCGFCTPGMVLKAVELIERTNAPSQMDIVKALDGHICRCGTYPRIVTAIRAAAEVMIDD